MMLCIIAHHYIVNSGILEQITRENVISLNSIFSLLFGGEGGKTAFTYVGWFMVLYLITSYIRLYPKKLFENRKVCEIFFDFYIFVLGKHFHEYMDICKMEKENKILSFYRYKRNISSFNGSRSFFVF